MPFFSYSSTGTVVPALTLPLLRVTAEFSVAWKLYVGLRTVWRGLLWKNICERGDPFQEIAQVENADAQRVADLKLASNSATPRWFFTR